MASADAVGVGGREAFGVRQLAAALFLCPNNVSVPMFPISQMTGHATRFHPPNRATEHTPVGCGEESPRSCRRVRMKTDGRERGRPRPHQRDDRSYDPFGSSKCGVRAFTGWGRARMPALLPARWRKHRRSGARPSSAASTRRPTLRPVWITQMPRPNIHRLGMHKQRVCPHIRIRRVPPQTSATVD
ncbi:MAG: hypothetical protein GX456_07705 [Verrucomicrobia bacterium]|nr:hypothetical protein [Verrucomicrobiota bacterium]